MIRRLVRTQLIVAAVMMVSGVSTAWSAPLPVFRGTTVSPDITPADIQDLRALGANVFRFPISCGPLCDSYSEEQYQSWFLGQLAYFESTVLPAAQSSGIKIVLALVTAPGGYAPKAKLPNLKLFTEKWTQTRFIANWELLAQRFGANQTILAFDLLTEPAQGGKPKAGLLDWNGVALAAATAIRAIEPDKLIYVEPFYGAPERLAALKVPALPNMGVSFNMYYTLQFTHQGLDQFKNLVITYPSKKLTARMVARRLGIARSYQRRHKNVPMHIGEFTAARWTGDSGNRYLGDLIRYFERAKWSWNYHAFREATVWSFEYTTDRKVAELSPVPTKREILLKQYFARNG